MPALYETHRAQLKAILQSWGMEEDNADITADILGWKFQRRVCRVPRELRHRASRHDR